MATITAVASGNWSDDAIWDLGRVPAQGDTIDLSAFTVVFDLTVGVDAVSEIRRQVCTATGRLDLIGSQEVGGVVVPNYAVDAGVDAFIDKARRFLYKEVPDVGATYVKGMTDTLYLPIVSRTRLTPVYPYTESDWFLVNRPDALVFATCWVIERENRNTQGASDFYTQLRPIIAQLVADCAESEMSFYEDEVGLLQPQEEVDNDA